MQLVEDLLRVAGRVYKATLVSCVLAKRALHVNKQIVVEGVSLGDLALRGSLSRQVCDFIIEILLFFLLFLYINSHGFLVINVILLILFAEVDLVNKLFVRLLHSFQLRLNFVDKFV